MNDTDARFERFFDLHQAVSEEADVIMLPLPYEGTVCYGMGTADGPAAIWEASRHVELWDEETGLDLSGLAFHSALPVQPEEGERPGDYHARLETAARPLHGEQGLVFGVGGEHSLTPPLVAAAAQDPEEMTGITVVQFDAHADLRDEYQGTPFSHACAMRPMVTRGAELIAIGIRSAERQEAAWGEGTGRVSTWYEHELESADREEELLFRLRELEGAVYLTIDIDGLEPSLCPGTGTPVPGGLSWRQTMRYLRALLKENAAVRLIGCDVVETAPQLHTQVNEYTAARLIAKILAYRFS